jgi:hypothetical protein
MSSDQPSLNDDLAAALREMREVGIVRIETFTKLLVCDSGSRSKFIIERSQAGLRDIMNC